MAQINSSRVYLDEFVRRAAASVPAGGRVLDAGAGIGLYRHHFEHVGYESADFEEVPNKPYGKTDYVCDLAAVPVKDDRYDLLARCSSTCATRGRCWPRCAGC